MQARAHFAVRPTSALLVLLSACSGGHDSINDTAAARVPAAASVPLPPSVMPVAPPIAAPRSAREDSLIARARVVVMAANPDFHEWPDAAYAPVEADSAVASARFGPLVGDLDGDGIADVVFDGYDREGGLTPAVLSNRGKAHVVPVTEGEEVAAPPAPRRKRWMLAPFKFDGEHGLGVAFIDYDEGGKPFLPPTVYFLHRGRFARIAVGD